jgi:hypothetical protein
MGGGKLDFYSAEFKQLAILAEYNLEERLVGRKYFDGLPEGLHRAIVKDKNMNLLTTVADYEDAAIRYHCKFLQYQTFFERLSKNPKKPIQHQWQQCFAKDSNAMDTTPGCICARSALSEDKMAKLCKEGKCFRCKCQGHIVLRHGRDVHPTWVMFTMTGTLRVWTVVLCESTKFEENLVSF